MRELDRKPLDAERNGESLTARPLNILHVIDSGGLYGAENMLLSLGVECRRLGHKVVVGTIVSPGRNDPLGEAAVAKGLAHVEFPMQPGFSMRGVRCVLETARELQIDVIHSHGYKANIMLALVPRGFRPCSMICTLHGWTSIGKLSRLALYEQFERRVVCRFDRVMVVSPTIQAQLPGAHGRVQLVPNGVPFRQAANKRSSPSGESGDADRPVRLLAVGRLSPEKGFDLLIAAIGILMERGVEVRLTIAGEGPQRRELEAAVTAAGLSSNVALPGYVKGLERLYREADLFILCSRTEGLPLVLLEAMSHGVPVIATAVGQVPDVLGHGRFGRLLPVTDPTAIADAIQSHMSAGSSSIEGMSARAAMRVRDSYSVAAMAAEYVRAYRECVDGR